MPDTRQNNSDTNPLPTAEEAKAEARALRAARAADGHPLPHSRALEIVARSHGFRDWNTMSAAIAKPRSNRWTAGMAVSGRYLDQPFTGRIHSVDADRPGWVRLALQLDAAVDVVTFDSFSNFRTRIHATVGPDGRTAEKTSNGVAHLVLDL